MVRTGGDDFWPGLSCHNAILALLYRFFSSRMGRCRCGRPAPVGAWGHYGRASGPGGQSADVPAEADSATLEQLALASDIAQKWLEGQPPRRVIVVPGKLVNLVP